MEPTYTKTEDGKLQITETKEVVKEVSLEALKGELELRLKNRDLLNERIAEIESLIVEAGKLGVVEKVKEVVEVPVEISPEKIDEPVESAIVAE